VQTVVQETLTAGDIVVRLAAVFGLVLLNGFFVAAEFALVGARRSRLTQLAEEGHPGAKHALKALGRLDHYISGTQVGITIASLALGWIGEPAVAVLVDRLLGLVGIEVPPGATHTAAAVTTAFVILMFLHIVLGEQAPKFVAISSPERASSMLALPLMVFSKVTAPFISVLNGAANGLLRLMGFKGMSQAHQVHSPEELRLLVMQARAHGTLDESDSAMLAGVFDFHEKRVRDVMRPRTDVVALEIDESEEDVRALLQRERYSRYPVYRETLDDVVGVFVAKDLWLHDAKTPFRLADSVREALYVPSTRAATRVLDDLRKTRAHMAVVLDEYGGTAGIVTMEDLVEEVIGDIADEHDMASREAIEVDGVLELAGSISLVDARSDHRLRIPEGEWSTLGGFVFGALGRVPRIGDRVRIPGAELEVVAMDGRRVAAVRVHRERARVPA
jgi:CBS domain containing-hemolysin-like protein